MNQTDAMPITSLEFKPDFAEARRRWEAFWNQELIDRPCCVIRSIRDGATPVPGAGYTAEARQNPQTVIDKVVAGAATVYWAGEAIPSYTPSFGPDQLAAWLGAELKFAPEEGTSWALPYVEDWDACLPFKLDPQNPWWRRMLDFCRDLERAARGKMVITHLDLHSNMDALLAVRGGERLCMDMLDMPETIDRAMRSVRGLYRPIYDGIYSAAGMARTGTLGWVNAYHSVRTATIQCDFAALIGPEHFRRWVGPALEEEAAFLGHCVYHLDGPECLVHLKDLCAIKGLDCIQWVHGARNRPFIEWMDLLKEIQALGVSVWIPCSPEEVKIYHRELKPNMLFYDIWAPNQHAVDETLRWLKQNT
jgi:hypothetical protein